MMDKRIVQPLGTLPGTVGSAGNSITSWTQVLPEDLFWVFASADQLVMAGCFSTHNGWASSTPEN